MLLLMLISAAAAKAEEITSGNFVYDIVQFLGSDEDEAVIIGLADGFEPSGELSFPTTISHKGKDVKVTGLGWSNHAGCESDLPVIGGHHGITSVRIPRYMRFIGRIEFKDCPNIKRYEVESGSAVYTTIEGVLVEIADYSGTTRRHLKRYPSAARAASYVVPSSVDDISFGAFAANTHLKKSISWVNIGCATAGNSTTAASRQWIVPTLRNIALMMTAPFSTARYSPGFVRVVSMENIAYRIPAPISRAARSAIRRSTRLSSPQSCRITVPHRACSWAPR